jgi:hypothetical protein
MSLVLQSSGGGSVTIAEPTTASDFTQTLPAADGVTMVSGNMPAFSAYANTTQSISTTTFTKVAINTELFDTNSNFDSTTNYRFTPTVEGYYQVNGTVRMAASTNTIVQTIAILYKNGAAYARGTEIVNSSSTIQADTLTFNEIVYMNGSTDYIELYGFVTGTSPSFNFANTGATSRFSACLLRGA